MANEKTIMETLVAFMAGIIHSKFAVWFSFILFAIMCITSGALLIYGIIAAVTGASIWYMLLRFGAFGVSGVVTLWLLMHAFVLQDAKKDA